MTGAFLVSLSLDVFICGMTPTRPVEAALRP